MNPKLSILVPAIPGRMQRLKVLISRCSMSIQLYNHKYEDEPLTREDVEFVIVDGGSKDVTKNMCMSINPAHIMKYIYLPIGGFINAGYPRNVGLRVCQGDVIGHLDIDHYPSENIVEGMLRPFVEGKIDRHINRGYVVDSSKSPNGHGPMGKNEPWLRELNSIVLNQANLRSSIESVYRESKIPPPGKNNTLWIWAAKNEYIRYLNGYDEQYCRMYVREDDDWRERMLANGMPFYDGAGKEFCAIHLWHPAAWRNESNDWNKDYFNLSCHPVREVERNKDRTWGRMLEGSFSVMDSEYREPDGHEAWVHAETEYSGYIANPMWKDIDEFKESLR